MKDQVKAYRTNNYYEKIILPRECEISQADVQGDILYRYAPRRILKLINTAGCFPEAAINNIFGTRYGISGDWWDFTIHCPYDASTFYWGGLLVRPGKAGNNQIVMKADPYYFDPTNKDEISACHHLSCDGRRRYIAINDYLCCRESLNIETPYATNNLLLSVLMPPILAGLQLIRGRIPVK